MTVKQRQFIASLPDKRTSSTFAKIYDIVNPVTNAVTQATSRTTGVTVTTLAGAITTHTASLAAETAAAFVVTCADVAVGDVVVLSIRSGAVGAMTAVNVSAVAAGSFTINVLNNNAAAGTAETGAIVINYRVLQARV